MTITIGIATLLFIIGGVCHLIVYLRSSATDLAALAWSLMLFAFAAITAGPAIH